MNRCPNCQRLLMNDAPICEGCLSTTRRRLSELAGFVEAIENDPDLYLVPSRTGQGSGSSEISSGVNDFALNFSTGHDILGVLNAWESYARFGQDLAEKITPKGKISERVRVCCDFLLVHFLWLAKSDLVEDFVREIGEQYAVGIAATKQTQASETRIQCQSDVDNALCGVYLKIGGLEMDDEVICPKCRTRWSVRWLIRVGMSNPDSRPYSNIEDIAYFIGITTWQVRYLAKKWEIPKQGSQYHLKTFTAKYQESLLEKSERKTRREGKA